MIATNRRCPALLTLAILGPMGQPQRSRPDDPDAAEQRGDSMLGWWIVFVLACFGGVAAVWIYGAGSESTIQRNQGSVARTPMDRQMLDKLAADPAVLSAGKKVFQARCTSCHRVDGGGQVGPNLTDTHQLHGSTSLDLHTVIRVGVPSKGMIAWESALKPEDLDAVAAYVISLRGVDVAGGKSAQGRSIAAPEGNAPAMPARR